MKLYGLDIPVKNAPVLDTGYVPMAAFCRAFDKSAAGGKDIAVAVERNQGQMAVRHFRIHGTPEMAEADRSMSTARSRCCCGLMVDIRCLSAVTTAWPGLSKTPTSPAALGNSTRIS